MENLLAYTKQLNACGLTAYCLTGAYSFPSPTITGSVETDLVYLSEVLGVKLAISDHRSYFPTEEEILRLAAQARNGALISGKAGVVHLHLGKDPQGLKTILKLVEHTACPVWHFRPTHVLNNLPDAIRFAQLGGMIDFTSSTGPYENAVAIKETLAQVPSHLITVSSDANGSIPVWDEHNNMVGMAIGDESSLIALLKELVCSCDVDLPTAVSLLTSNVADGLKLSQKGRIENGTDADILLLDSDFHVTGLFVRGEKLVSDGTLTYQPYFR